jgi:hypothetical protein
MYKQCESYQILSQCTKEMSHEFNFTSDTVNSIVGIMCTWSGYKITTEFLPTPCGLANSKPSGILACPLLSYPTTSNAIGPTVW